LVQRAGVFQDLVHGLWHQIICREQGQFGGSQGALRSILEVCLRRLRRGGRLVISAVTLDNVSEAYAALREQGLVPEVTLLNVSRGVPLAQYLRYEALNPIHIFAVGKPGAAAGGETETA